MLDSNTASNMNQDISQIANDIPSSSVNDVQRVIPTKRVKKRPVLPWQSGSF